MQRRIIFSSNEIRNSFFEEVLVVSQFKNWQSLANFFQINRNLLLKYRLGKLTLPEEIFRKLILMFDSSRERFFESKVSYVDPNWGRIEGGKSTYNRHREIFEHGRQKAIETSKRRAHKFNVDIPLGEELSYFIGLFIGDGFTNKYQRYHIIQFTGDKRFEGDFYRGLITQYSRQLFNLNPTIYEGKNTNALRFNLYSKELFHLITQRFKISAGRKSKKVLIPQKILDSRPEILKACIRGLYDAEGCVFFDKRKLYKKPYVRIELHMHNLQILKQVSKILSLFEIENTLGSFKDNLRVVVYGKEQVKKFVKEVGFSNPKHLSKLKSLI